MKISILALLTLAGCSSNIEQSRAAWPIERISINYTTPEGLHKTINLKQCAETYGTINDMTSRAYNCEEGAAYDKIN